jgi:AAA domain
MNDAAAVNVIRGAMECSTGPHDDRWRARYDDIPRAVSSAREKYGDDAAMSQGPEGLRENPRPHDPRPFVFNPEPYDPPDPASIPKREWLYGRHYLRGIVSASLGAPGRLKSTTSMTELIGMGVGRDLLTGEPLECGPLRVAYLNGEENQDELDRRFAGICQRHSITKQDFGGRIWIMSTRDNPIRLAIPGPKGAAVVAEGVVDAVLAWCEARSIDVLAVDPLISFHRVRENDSGDMDLLCKEAFGAIAGKNRSVDLVVHPRKPAPGEINTTIDDLRGSSAPARSCSNCQDLQFHDHG